MRSPTEAQIKFAELIAEVLNIDFPTCSLEFNRASYYDFISTYYNAFREIVAEDPAYDDDEMMWFDPFAEGGY